jgi:hypothetical protein
MAGEGMTDVAKNDMALDLAMANSTGGNRPVLPAPQTGALAAPPDISGTEEGADSLAQPLDMGKLIAQHQVAAGQINNDKPGDWARNAVAGVQAALAGFGAGGKVPPGAGALYGIGAAARAGQENRLKQQQMKIEQQKALSEQDLNKAQIAHLNAEQHNIEKLGRNADRETMQKMVDFDIAAAQPYIEAGTDNLGEGLTSDDLQRMLKAGPNGKPEINGHEVRPFRDGLTDVIGPDGKPQLDADGVPLQRPTYRLFAADGPPVQLTEAQAKLISDNTSAHPAAGQTMSPIALGTLQTLAKKNLAVNLNIEKIQSDIGKNKADEAEAEGKTKDTKEEKDLKAQAAKIFSPYLAKADGDPWKAVQMMGSDPAGKAQIGIVEQAYGPGNIAEWHEKQEAIDEKRREDDLKKQAGADYTGNPDAATPQEFLASLPPSQRETIKMIGEGRVPLNSPTYLLARKPEILDAVAKAYPGFDASKVTSYQKTYADFTSGKTSVALNAGATALQHLSELRQLNTNASRIPGTAASQAYQNKVNTVAPELARFYGNDTDIGVKNLKDTLDSYLNRDAAITTQAKSMGDKLDNYETTWTNAAPSKAYQAPMPGISDQAKLARASMDPEYAAKLIATGPNGQKLMLKGGQWVPVQ